MKASRILGTVHSSSNLNTSQADSTTQLESVQLEIWDFIYISPGQWDEIVNAKDVCLKSETQAGTAHIDMRETSKVHLSSLPLRRRENHMVLFFVIEAAFSVQWANALDRIPQTNLLGQCGVSVLWFLLENKENRLGAMERHS